MTNPLPRSFYTLPALEAAPALLGCLLVHERQGERLIGRIVEVEAYGGADDAASHAYGGRTPRSRIMFGPAGFAYVYFIYGNHHCLNVVTGGDGEAAAVLIRAVEPVQGVEIMQTLRMRASGRNLSNGPGKLCQALGIDRTLNGHDLTIGSDLWLEPGPSLLNRVCVSPRVGVRGDERARAAPWRFFLANNAYVSPSPLNKLATLQPTLG